MPTSTTSTLLVGAVIVAVLFVVLAVVITHAVTQSPRRVRRGLPRAVPCVDVVLTWVDATDAAWRDKHNAALAAAHDSGLDADGVAHEMSERTPNTDAKPHGCKHYDEGYFSVISICRFMPWVRRLNFVTQKPQKPWYWDELASLTKDANVELRLVHHDDFIPADRLPTFNSCVIELFLDRIPQLAEHFILFNDDFFVGKPMSAHDFFDLRGRPIYVDSPEAALWLGRQDDYMWSHLVSNSADLVQITRGLNARPFIRTFSHVALPFARRQFAVWRAAAPLTFRGSDPPSVRSVDDVCLPLLMTNMPTVKDSKALTKVVSKLPYSKTVWFNWSADDSFVPQPQPDMFCIQSCQEGKGGCNAMQLALEKALLVDRPTRRVKGNPTAALGSAPCLMVVSHPDDEVLWGLSLLTAPGTRWHLICLSHANTLKRRREFASVVLELPHVEVAEMWDAPDVPSMPATMRHRIALVMQQTGLRLVASHGAKGEYGHPHHKRTSDLVATQHQEQHMQSGTTAPTTLLQFAPKHLPRDEGQAVGTPLKRRLLARYESQNTYKHSFYAEEFTVCVGNGPAAPRPVPATEAQRLCTSVCQS